MSSYRNHDNFDDPYDYIINQLFIYDYTDTDDFNILKMKIWVLDGVIRDEETVTDTDVSNPVNHFDWLLNELTFLDRYVRTEDGTLDEDEMNFDDFVQYRINQRDRFITRINPNTGEYYHDYDQPYNVRPTLLTDDQFQELYDAYKIKETNGELTTAFEITSSVTTYCIDDEALSAENTIDNNVTPAEMEAQLLINATAKKAQNDYNFVTEMNRCYDEMWNITKSLAIDASSLFADWAPATNYVENDIRVYSGSIYICNIDHLSGALFEPAKWDSLSVNVGVMLFPHKREQIVLTASDSSHKGTIQSGDGYRFENYKKPSDGTWYETWPAPDEADVCNIPAAYQNEYGEEEDTAENFIFVIYYEDLTPLTHLETAGLTIDDLPSGGSDVGDLTRERFDILNSRWITINNRREYEISSIGTRVIIEVMLDTDIPNLLPDKESHFEDVKDQKTYYTDVLKEICIEFN